MYSSGDFVYHSPGNDPKHPTQTAAIQFQQTVELQGGGAHGEIGANSIHVGWLQNLVSQDVTVTYDNGRTVTVGYGEPLPLLDSGAVNAGSGGASDFLRNSNEGLRQNTQTGVDKEVTAVDSPGIPPYDKFPGTESQVQSINGKLGVFKAYVAAYSSDFNQWYGAYLEVNWFLNYHFRFPVFDSSKSITVSAKGSTKFNSSNPKSLYTLGTKTVGPTATTSASLETH